MTHTEYIDLLREVATNHVDIAHTPEQSHFARLVLSNDPFMPATKQIAEYLNGIRNVLHTPLMLGIAYDSDYRDDRADNIERMINGAFIILEDVQLNDFDNEEQIYTKTERIGWECLGYLQNYFSENPIKGFFEFNNAGDQKIAKLNNRFFGTRFSFGVLHSSQENIYYNPDKFLNG